MVDRPDPPSLTLSDSLVVERELGRGGMATVYLARDLKHGREVAVKLMRPELTTVLGSERFSREIQLAAGLQHPHILPVLDSGESAGRLWYTMPYVQGGSLRARLDREGPLAVDEALGIARDVAGALSHAHAQGVVHRDIKPENILFSNGLALIADFGIARAIDQSGTERLTETGIGVGTPEYMSPEQCLGDTSVDGRSDLYALAAVLYEMLTGEPPFTGPNAQAIIAKRLTLPAPSVRLLRETVSESVDAALARALSRLPADRYRDTGEFITALGSLGPAPGPARPASQGRRPLTTRLVVGLLPPALVAAGWWYMHRPPVPPAASTIAVFPMVPSSADTALTRLGRDLATTMSASLDGVGEVRTVDRLSVLAQVPEQSGGASLAEAGALGRSLGATSVLHGSLAREGARVRVDIGLYTTDSLAPLTRISLLGNPDSLTTISDALTRQLLEDIWRRGTPPTPTIEAALATRSIPALRAFLDGERELVAGRWKQARSAFARAIEADSSFWFAYYRYGNAMGWAEADVDSAVENAYRRHRMELPPKERLMIEASRGDSGMTRQRAKLEAIVKRYPDYWPAWWMLGDNMWHNYPGIGGSLADARAALEQVVTLNPSMAYAWQHLGTVYLQQRDTTSLIRAIARLEELRSANTFVQNEGTDFILLYRLELALFRAGVRDEAVVDSFYQSVIAHRIDPWDAAIWLTGQGFGTAQIRVGRRLLVHGLPSYHAEEVSKLVVFAWAMRGAWDSAMVEARRLSPPFTAIDAYRLAVLGSWVGGLPAGQAARYRPAAEKEVAAQGPGYQAELAWLDGVLAAAEKDSGKLTAARQRVQATGAQMAGVLDRSLAAFQAALSGDVRTAGREMAALEWEVGGGSPWYMFSPESPHTVLRGVDRLAAAEWAATAGDTATAIRLLSWHQAAAPPFDDKVSLGPLVFLLRARLADGQGDTALARQNYEQFLARYDAPVQGLRHLVPEAQEALLHLAGRPGAPREQ